MPELKMPSTPTTHIFDSVNALEGQLETLRCMVNGLEARLYGVDTPCKNAESPQPCGIESRLSELVLSTGNALEQLDRILTRM